MALVVFGQGVAKMSGKLGGTVFAHNAGGAIARNFVVPTDPGSAQQDAVRTIMAGLVNHWVDTLTGAQRTDWDTYGANVARTNRLGETIFLSGISSYVGANTQRIQGGLPRVDDGPPIFDRGETDATVAMAISEATQQATITFDDTLDWASEDDAGMALFLSRPQNTSKTFFKGPYRLADMLEGDAGVPLASPQVIAIPFSVVAGQNVHARAIITRGDGRYTASTFLVNNVGA